VTEHVTPRTDLDEAIVALKQDLVAEGGPKISTMRNYRFAIVPYRPSEEFRLRLKVRQLGDTLRAEGWNILSISLHALMMKRIRAMGDGAIGSLIERERRRAPGPGRAESGRHRPCRVALPLPADLGPAQAHRRQDPKHPGRAALPRGPATGERALLHGGALGGPRLPASALPVKGGGLRCTSMSSSRRTSPAIFLV